MNERTKEIMQEIKGLGLNVVGCKAKKMAHRIVYTVFLDEQTENEIILQKAKEKGFDLVFNFLQDYGNIYRHNANKLLTIQEAV